MAIYGGGGGGLVCQIQMVKEPMSLKKSDRLSLFVNTWIWALACIGTKYPIQKFYTFWVSKWGVILWAGLDFACRKNSRWDLE